jgi:predicted Kef-type K+ transport protein
LNTYLRLPDLLLAITLLLGISAIVIPVARRLGIGPELGLLLSGVILGSSHFLAPTQVDRLREPSELGVVVTHAQFANGIMVIALTTIMTSWLDALGVAFSRLSSPAMPSPKISTS